MNPNVYSAVGLLVGALLASVLPALLHWKQFQTPEHFGLMRPDYRGPGWLNAVRGFLVGELGSAINYLGPINLPPGSGVTAFTSGATAPTAAQVQGGSPPALYADVFFADADGAVNVVHNWGAAGLLGATNAAMIANAAFIQVIVMKTLGGASDSSFATNFTFGLAGNTNQITITKIGNGTGQGGTYRVCMRLPFSASF